MSLIEIRGEQQPIYKVFGDDFAFVVPAYQRPYAWTTEHASELFEDLREFLGEGDQPVNELPPYFLGSIVLIKGTTPQAEIVDGQQRLITLTLLFVALRHVLPPETAQGLTAFIYEKGNPLIPAAADRCRLTPRTRDADFFRRHIQQPGGLDALRTVAPTTLNDSQQHMRENALLLLDKLRELSPEMQTRLAQYVLNRCFVVIVSTPDLDAAYRIFSVLNDRGLDLSYTDILKAEIIGGIPVANQQDYTARWEAIEDGLGRRDFDALMAHIRMIALKKKSRESYLKEYRDIILRELPAKTYFVDEMLVPYAAAYTIIHDADYQSTHGASEVNRQLVWLNRLRSTVRENDWVPVAMLYLARSAGQPERLARFLADLERLAVGMRLLGHDITKRVTRFGKVLKAIEDGEDVFGASSPLQLTPAERTGVVRELDGAIYDNQSSSLVKYVLLRLDNQLAGGEAQYTTETVTIEHVLPQNPPQGSEWIRWFSSQEVHDRWVHRLGNLVLLSRTKNSRAGNLSFAEKKRDYFATKDGIAPFALTTQVLQQQMWTPGIVGMRQKELVTVLKQLWRLEATPAAVPVLVTAEEAPTS